MVEMLDRMVPNEDPEISKELQKAFDKKKITTITGGKVTGVEKLKTKVKVKVETAEGEQIVDAEQVLMAASFLPNSKGFGLEEIGVKLNERGFIEIDERMATNVPGDLGDRRRDRQADAGPRRDGPGRGVRREYRRRADRDPELPQYAQGDLLPAAGGLLRDDRGTGQRGRLRGQGRALQLPGQRQGARPGRLCRLCQAGHRRHSTARSSART